MNSSSLLIAGVDEAGRGCVFGPLVIAGVSLQQSKIPELVRAGVKDSKLLSPKKRTKLSAKIRKEASSVSVWKISPQKIDSVVLNGERLHKLNYLEARYMAHALRRIDWDLAFVDCCDTNEQRFGKLVSSLVGGKVTEIRSEHHADRNHPIVAAASIIAKVERDAEIEDLWRRHGAFGSGYPSDRETIEYLERFLASPGGRPPEFTRLSWKTVRRLSEEEDL